MNRGRLFLCFYSWLRLLSGAGSEPGVCHALAQAAFFTRMFR